MLADILIGFYRWWHGRCRIKGAGLLIKFAALWNRGLQNYPLPIAGHGTVLLDLRDIGSFMWLNYAIDGRHQEEALIAIVRAITKPNQVLWDVGANVGLVSALCTGDEFGFRRIEAFEPNPALQGRLHTLFANSSCVRVHNMALGDRDALTMLNLRRGDSTRSSLVAEGVESVEIPVRTGDSLVQAGTVETPDIIKIDTEGFEAQVLAGLEKTLMVKKPCLLIEESPLLDVVVSRYVSAGYRRFYITRDGHLTSDKNHPVRGHNGALIPPHFDISELLA